MFTTARQWPLSWVMNPAHNFPSYFPKIHFNIIFPATYHLIATFSKCKSRSSGLWCRVILWEDTKRFGRPCRLHLHFTCLAVTLNRRIDGTGKFGREEGWRSASFRCQNLISTLGSMRPKASFESYLPCVHRSVYGTGCMIHWDEVGS
jgi:hypothetical protein